MQGHGVACLLQRLVVAPAEACATQCLSVVLQAKALADILLQIDYKHPNLTAEHPGIVYGSIQVLLIVCLANSHHDLMTYPDNVAIGEQEV